MFKINETLQHKIKTRTKFNRLEFGVSAASLLVVVMLGHFIFVQFPLTGDSNTFWERGLRADCFELPFVCLGDGQIEIVNFYGILSIYQNDIVEMLSSFTGTSNPQSFHLIHSGLLLLFVIAFLFQMRLFRPKIYLVTLMLAVPPLILVSSYHGQLDLVAIVGAIAAVSKWESGGRPWTPQILLGFSIAYKPSLFILPLLLMLREANPQLLANKQMTLRAVAKPAICYAALFSTWLPTLLYSVMQDRGLETLEKLRKELFSYNEPSSSTLFFGALDNLGLIRWHTLITLILVSVFSLGFRKESLTRLTGIHMLLIFAFSFRFHPQYVVFVIAGLLLSSGVPVLNAVVLVFSTLHLLNQYSHPWAVADITWVREYRDTFSVEPWLSYLSASSLQLLALFCCLAMFLMDRCKREYSSYSAT